MEMTRTALVWIILVLAFLGIADSWYLAQSAMTGAPLVCDIGSLDGCNTVAQSEYSRVFGIPLALYGVGFYGFIFVLGAFLLTNNVRRFYLGAVALSGAGVVASLYFLYLQLFVIKATCIYCLASLVISVLLGIATTVLWKRFAPPKAIT